MSEAVIGIVAYALGMLTAFIVVLIFLPDPDDLRRSPPASEPLPEGSGGNLPAWEDPLEILGLDPRPGRRLIHFDELDDDVRIIGESPPIVWGDPL